MKVTLVCGLLGAGKTSFIRNCIDSAGEKTVVLVNDFGSLGIDGEIISSGGLESVELPSGCICCTLKMDLIDALKRIDRDMSPEHLVIEPSGLASPSGVLEAIGVLEYSRLDVVCIGGGDLRLHVRLQVFDKNLFVTAGFGAVRDPVAVGRQRGVLFQSIRECHLFQLTA